VKQYRAAWRELRELIQERARAAQVETKRMHDLQCFITTERALSFGALLAAVKEVVTDPDTLQEIQQPTPRLLPPIG
jgi:hypothetical protein